MFKKLYLPLIFISSISVSDILTDSSVADWSVTEDIIETSSAIAEKLNLPRLMEQIESDKHDIKITKHVLFILRNTEETLKESFNEDLYQKLNLLYKQVYEGISRDLLSEVPAGKYSALHQSLKALYLHSSYTRDSKSIPYKTYPFRKVIVITFLKWMKIKEATLSANRLDSMYLQTKPLKRLLAETKDELSREINNSEQFSSSDLNNLIYLIEYNNGNISPSKEFWDYCTTNNVIKLSVPIFLFFLAYTIFTFQRNLISEAAKKIDFSSVIKAVASEVPGLASHTKQTLTELKTDGLGLVEKETDKAVDFAKTEFIELKEHIKVKFEELKEDSEIKYKELKEKAEEVLVHTKESITKVEGGLTKVSKKASGLLGKDEESIVTAQNLLENLGELTNTANEVANTVNENGIFHATWRGKGKKPEENSKPGWFSVWGKKDKEPNAVNDNQTQEVCIQIRPKAQTDDGAEGPAANPPVQTDENGKNKLQ